MIRIYILEDDPSIIHNLTQIITGEKLGIICGDSADGMPSTAEILATRPDVIMLDFFMPQRDGIEVVTDLRAQGCASQRRNPAPAPGTERAGFAGNVRREGLGRHSEDVRLSV